MLTQQMEGFTLDILKEIPQGQAYANHYKVKSMAVADSCATKLLRKAQIVARLQELRKPAVDSTKMLVQEREERLSELAREDIISVKGTLLRDGNIRSIQELNKMEGAYAPEKHLTAIQIEVVYKDATK